jgi:hypothetical protein
VGGVKMISNTQHKRRRLVSTLYSNVSTLCSIAAGTADIVEAYKLRNSVIKIHKLIKTHLKMCNKNFRFLIV